jgi:acetyltransferase-like isoleucine patch superfamily enzyme
VSDLGSHPYHPLCVIVGSPEIGEGTWIGAHTLIDGSGGLRIGQGCDISAGAHVYSHSTVRRCVTERKEPSSSTPTRIGDHTFIGPNAVILMGVSIGSGCVVGAGAVVTRDVPDRTCVVGVPARAVGEVDPVTGSITYLRARGGYEVDLPPGPAAPE